MRSTFILASILALSAPVTADEIVPNGGFETTDAWISHSDGPLTFDTEIKHSGERSLVCHLDDVNASSGARQQIVLNQETIVPLHVSGWSRAEEVGGAKDYHYSVWLDIEYVDDTRPGRVDDWLMLPFDVGTHDWQHVEAILTPARPIRHFSLYAMFRRHTGTVWFDDFSITPLLRTRTSGAPDDFTDPPPGFVPEEFVREVARADPAETVLMVARERLQDYHLDPPAGSIDGRPLSFDDDRALWHGKLAYTQSSLRADTRPDIPGLHVLPTLGRWSETELTLTAVGAQGNAYRVFVALPAGLPLRGVRFTEWEPQFDSAAAYRIGDRVLLSNLLEVMSGTDTVRWMLLDQSALEGATVPPRDRASETTLDAGGALALAFSADGALTALTTGGAELTLPEGRREGGWLSGEAGLYVGDLFAAKLRRVSGTPQAADGAVTVEGTLDEMDLAARATFRVAGEAVIVEGEVRDLRGEPRSIDVALKLPVELSADAIIWHDLTTAQPLAEIGRTEMTSYPWLTVSDGGHALALGIDGHYPARQSIIYDPEEGLHARIKLGIIPDGKPHLRGRVPFGFVIMPVDTRWMARDAARRYYEAYPDLFATVPHREGLWLFGAHMVDRVPNPEDFSYYEGPRTLPDYIRDAGVLAAPYIIPNQRALTRLKRLPESYEEAMELLSSRDPEADGWGGRGSREIILDSAIVTADGEYPITIRDDVGADFKPDPPVYNVVFPVNPDPDLASGREEMETIATLATMPDVGGIYTDSGASWSARYLNFREEHFRVADLPLTYDDETGRVAIFGKAPPVEHWRAMADILHPLGDVVFANLGHDTQDPWSWFAVDICGSEQGRTTDQFLNYARTLAYHKPILYLGYLRHMGVDMFLMDRDQLLRHVRRCALMGIMPSIAIRPGYVEWYEENGDIYRQYMPVIKRLSAAGWEPVTNAKVAGEDVRIERFGPKDGVAYFTLLNEGTETVEVTLTLDLSELGATGVGAVTELLSGEEASLDSLRLASGELAVLAVELRG